MTPADELPRRFELWLDASDGSCRLCWGVLWPDGTASLRNANHPELDAITGPTLEAVLFRSGIDERLRRVVWIDAEPSDPARALLGTTDGNSR